MDEKIIIYPDKIIWVFHNDQAQLQHYIINTDTEFQRILRCPVQIQPWVTVGNFMSLLEKFVDFIEQYYFDVLGGFDFTPYLIDLNSDKTYEPTCDYIEFFHNVDVYKIREDSDQLEWNNWGSVRGVKVVVNENDNSDIKHISISLDKLSNFKDTNLRINDEFIIPNDSWEAPPILVTHKQWTFNELIESWLFEISYFGYPDDRDLYYQELMQGNFNNQNIQINFL